jgi:hypothetical protein
MKSRISRKRAGRNATIAGELMLTPLVMAMRLPLMASESRGNNFLGTEAWRAVAEKNAALAEGMLAAQLSLMRSASSFWFEVLSGRKPSLLGSAAAQRSAQAALKPASRRVKANFRRLSAKI